MRNTGAEGDRTPERTARPAAASRSAAARLPSRALIGAGGQPPALGGVPAQRNARIFYGGSVAMLDRLLDAARRHRLAARDRVPAMAIQQDNEALACAAGIP